MPDRTPTTEQAARLALDGARWECAFWARVIADTPTRVTDTAVTYISTPGTYRKYAEAVAAEAKAREAWLATLGVSA